MTDFKKKLISQNDTFICDWKRSVDNLYIISFTDNEGYRGEDWDVVPYEHNSENVDEEFIKYCLYIFIPKNFLVAEPNFNKPDSEYVKNDFKQSKVPFLSLVYVPILRERAQYEIQFSSFETIYNSSISMNFFFNETIFVVLNKIEKINITFGLTDDSEKINYFIY